MRWTFGATGTSLVACMIATACTDRLVGADGGDTGEGGNHDDGASEPETGGEDEDDPDGGPNHDDGADETLATVTEPTQTEETTYNGEGTVADETDGGVAMPCESVLTESRRCAFIDDVGDVQLVGLDTGNVCPYLDVLWERGPSIDAEIGGLAWHDDALFVCIGVLARIELDGSVTASELPCTWVTAHDDALVAYGTDPDIVREYATWDDAVALGPSTVHALSGMTASRFAIAEGVLYGAWHSTDRVERRSYEGGEIEDDLLLAGFDDWIDGIDVHLGEVLVASHGDLLRFDADSGAALGSIPIGSVGGSMPLDCR